jgi:hypothetical protein
VSWWRRYFVRKILRKHDHNIQASNKIKRQLFGNLNFGHCNLPFDLAQGGGELVEPFGICVLLFEIFYY